MTTPDQSLSDKLSGTMGSLQFAYFLFATDNSFDQFTQAGGVVPPNLRDQLKSALPSLIKFGIVSQEQINETVETTINALEADDIMGMFKNGDITKAVFTQMYESNPQLKAAIQVGFQQTINGTSLGQGLAEFSGVTLDTNQFVLPDGSNLLDMTVGELMPEGAVDAEKINAIFVGDEDNPSTLGHEQVLYILQNLPVEQAREAIEKLGTPADGKSVEGFPSTVLPDDASRFQIQTLMNEALDARANHELSQRNIFKRGWVNATGSNAALEGVLDSPETRIALAAGFEDMLGRFGQGAGLDGGSVYDFIVEDEAGRASTAVGENIKEIRAALIKSAEGDSNLNLFIDMLPDEDVNSMLVEQIRNIGSQFPMLQGLLQMAAQFLGAIAGSFPQIGKMLDVVANPVSIPEPVAEPPAATHEMPPP